MLDKFLFIDLITLEFIFYLFEVILDFLLINLINKFSLLLFDVLGMLIRYEVYLTLKITVCSVLIDKYFQISFTINH